MSGFVENGLDHLASGQIDQVVRARGKGAQNEPAGIVGTAENVFGLVAIAKTAHRRYAGVDAQRRERGIAGELSQHAFPFPGELGRIGELHERTTAACAVRRARCTSPIGRRREHIEQTGPSLAFVTAAMSGQVIQPDAHALARERTRDVDAQLLACAGDLRYTRAGVVDVRADCLEGVARP